MPIIILLDNSFSMNRNVSSTIVNGNNEPPPQNHQQQWQESKFQLAKNCLKLLIDHIKNNNHCKFEKIALLTYSRNYEIIAEFTNDFDLILNNLNNLQTKDVSNLWPAIQQAIKMILNYNHHLDLHYDIIIITDGVSNRSITYFINNDSDNDDHDSKQMKFPPNCKIHVVCLNTINDKYVKRSLPFFRKILSKNCSTSNRKKSININKDYDFGKIWIPFDKILTCSIIQNLFRKLCEENFQTYQGKIVCGEISGAISLYPNLPKNKLSTEQSPSLLDTIRICGFLNANEMNDSPIYSRHYVIPIAEKNLDEIKKWIQLLIFKSDQSDEDIRQSFCLDEGTQPSFAVLLNCSFKIANMIALCEIGHSRKWYGILKSVADKKRSHLMLHTFHPGLNSIPWLKNFQKYSLINADNSTENNEPATSGNSNDNSKNNLKKILNFNPWLQSQSVTADLQKISRLLKKLPDRYEQLLNEINRIKRAAIALKFFPLINVIIEIFEIEACGYDNYKNPAVREQIQRILNFIRNDNQQQLSQQKQESQEIILLE